VRSHVSQGGVSKLVLASTGREPRERLFSHYIILCMRGALGAAAIYRLSAIRTKGAFGSNI